MNGGFSRTELFARSAKGGAALMIAGSVAGTFARRAAADPISDSDLAYARLLVAAELLAADFYALVIAAKLFEGPALKSLKRALFNEHEHYDSVATILNDAGQPPAVAADIDFSYPKGAFASKASVASLGVTLETLFLGAYLGAVGGLQSSALEQPFARIAASEAQHLSAFTGLTGRDPVGISFPEPLSIDEASDALDAYTS
ncbi:MAG TPA: ferritin-like domain-containing protein [Gaiellaceae bacterium]|nr:ferritin-like domain-containing protein [Gaiellaceae bacterium]